MNQKHRLFATLATTTLAVLLLSTCQQSQPTAPATLESKTVSGQTVFVTFEGPWAIAPDPNDANIVLLMAPKTKAHRDLYVKASNDSMLATGVYQLSIPTPVGGAAGSYDPAILRAKIDPKNVQHLLDTKLDRYVIRLPKPEAYLPSGRARSRVSPTYPPDASTEKEYATGVSLRYTVQTVNGFSLAGTPDVGAAFNPLLLQVDPPGIRFEISSAEIDDACSTHSRTAFRDLVQLVGVTLYVDFPDNPTDCHGKDPQLAHHAKATAGLQLRPQLLNVADHDPENSARNLLAVSYLFGHPSGSCTSPIIGGGD